MSLCWSLAESVLSFSVLKLICALADEIQTFFIGDGQGFEGGATPGTRCGFSFPHNANKTERQFRVEEFPHEQLKRTEKQKDYKSRWIYTPFTRNCCVNDLIGDYVVVKKKIITSMKIMSVVQS